MTKPMIIFATLADHAVHRYPINGALKSLVPGDLVAVELPANCSVDGSTSEVQGMLADVEEHLRMRVRAAYTRASGDGVVAGGAPEGGTCDPSRYAAWKDNLDWIAADTVARVRTLLGAPRDGDGAPATYHDRLNAIEREYKVNIDIEDSCGSTFVYAYTSECDRLCFEFNSMNPDVEDVAQVAAGIAALKRVSDKRPSVGKMARVD